MCAHFTQIPRRLNIFFHPLNSWRTSLRQKQVQVNIYDNEVQGEHHDAIQSILNGRRYRPLLGSLFKSSWKFIIYNKLQSMYNSTITRPISQPKSHFHSHSTHVDDTPIIQIGGTLTQKRVSSVKYLPKQSQSLDLYTPSVTIDGNSLSLLSCCSVHCAAFL